MPGPTLTFSFIVATLLGAVFHLLAGGDARRLALFLLASWVGFGLGHAVGVLFQLNIFNIGTLRVATAALGALGALFLANFFTSSRKRKRVRQKV